MAVKKIRKTEQMSFDFEQSRPEEKTGKSKKIKPKIAKSKVKAKTKSVPKRPVAAAKARRKHGAAAATAESMAAKQRDISISEFFAKNRHLLGFDNPRKALLTAVKEAVDNSLDACEEAQILPELVITIKQLTEKKFVLTIRDNGPGIVKKQVPSIFAKLLYGSKFHSLKMSRGQQGIGISAAGMYGLLTTGEPVQIISRTDGKRPAHHYHVQIDTVKNQPEVVLDEECDFELPTGTQVTITLEGKYQKGKQSVDEYIIQTAMANPHASIFYNTPSGNSLEYSRQSNRLPFLPVEIKPHPYGVELGLLFKMARSSSQKKLSLFLQKDFSRLSSGLADSICKKAKLRKTLKTATITLKDAEALYEAISQTKIMAPPVNCIGPIGEEELLEGMKRTIEAEFYAVCSRKPAVYRGNPFLIEAALAYGAKAQTNGNNGNGEKETLIELKRIANRVPLLYQQGACAIYKSIVDTNWRNYGLSQSRSALPAGPIILMVHIASVWVPFTSESKEAIAHYPEITKEIKLSIQECGRKLNSYLRRQRKIKQEMVKRGYIETYLPYIGEALQEILSLKQRQVDITLERLKGILEKSRKT